jgi:hypothetical protein
MLVTCQMTKFPTLLEDLHIGLKKVVIRWMD